MIFFSGIPKPKNVRILLVTFAGKGKLSKLYPSTWWLEAEVVAIFFEVQAIFCPVGELTQKSKDLEPFGEGRMGFSTKAVSYLVESTEGYMASLFARFQQARRISYYTYTALFRTNMFEFEPKYGSMMVR